jgi:hypothetical protein
MSSFEGERSLFEDAERLKMSMAKWPFAELSRNIQTSNQQTGIRRMEIP